MPHSKSRNRVKRNVTTVLSGGRITETASDSIILYGLSRSGNQSTLRSTVEVSVRELAARIESQIVLSELARRDQQPHADPSFGPGIVEAGNRILQGRICGQRKQER